MTDYCGHNKCPECGAIAHRTDGKVTDEICSNCVEELREDKVDRHMLNTRFELIENYLKAAENANLKGKVSEWLDNLRNAKEVLKKCRDILNL